MSYILDALRKADAEREREQGRVPDLHAQPSAAAVPADDPPARARPLGWLVVGLAAGVGATALFTWLGRTPEPVGPAAVTPGPLPRPVPALASAPSPPAGDAPAMAASPPAGTVVLEAASGASGVAASSPASAAVAPPTPAVSTPPTTGSAATPARTATAGTAAPPPAAPPVAARRTPPEPREGAAKAERPRREPAPVPRLGELPEPLRRDLPQIVFGGSMYSEQRSARMVVLNGRVFREGDTIIPGLVLEEVRPRSAVLRYRDQRFSLP